MLVYMYKWNNAVLIFSFLNNQKMFLCEIRYSMWPQDLYFDAYESTQSEVTFNKVTAFPGKLLFYKKRFFSLYWYLYVYLCINLSNRPRCDGHLPQGILIWTNFNMHFLRIYVFCPNTYWEDFKRFFSL